MKVNTTLKKALNGDHLTTEDALAMIEEIKVGSTDSYLLFHAADSMSRREFENRGEVHAQIGINLGPCAKNCGFCVFGEKHGLVSKTVELSQEEVIDRAVTAQKEGANAIYLMTTAGYDFDRFLSTGMKVREAVADKMSLVANVGDFEKGEAKDLVNAGFTAIYHVVRLREGSDTGIDPADRMKTIEAAKAAGLDVSYCVEPIGPEHSAKEIVESMFKAKEIGVAVQATMRRIPVQGTPLFSSGQVTEVDQAKITAMARLVMGPAINAMGVHEPSMPSLLSGGNMIYAETGSNPRDTRAETREGRGRSVNECKKMLQEAGFKTFDGPARSLQGWMRD